ncbi:MAG: NADH-ubiquinone oxidoreductase-F iron-sulfur binding region domain-containing protein [Candidatus Falkowbacteria bacterium]
MRILEKIEEAALVGRGGGAFPVATKWATVKKAVGDKKYIIINASEGEPGVKKDEYILEHHLDEVLSGVKVADEFIRAEAIYFYLNHNYFNKYKAKIKKNAKGFALDHKLKLFVKPKEHLYIGGEESAILNIIEGGVIEPRLRPPYPAECGLFNCPTLINNVETFYNVALAERGDFYDFRFFTISGAASNIGVFNFPAKWTIKMVLQESGNYPNFPFFVQVGGDASGEVLNDSQLDRVVGGAGSIRIYDLDKHNSETLLRYWFEFFRKSSCGRCTPCREGTYRLQEMMESGKIDLEIFSQILVNLETSSLCALGASVPLPIYSYFKNILDNNLKKQNYAKRN